MPMIIVGVADRNRTVDEVMKERTRTGAEYLKLDTGELVKEIVEEIVEEKTPEEHQKPARKTN